MYLVKTPFWLRALYPSCTWRLPSKEKVVYLTFDDGPHPEITSFVLDQLKSYDAKATFFCIGNNVLTHPNIFEKIIQQGHAVGNHTYDHLNGWENSTQAYIDNIKSAHVLIHSNLFRPPYGRIKRQQINKIKSTTLLPQKIIMWDVLSGDFDKNLNGNDCVKNIIENTSSGSILVFHDSEKAWDRLKVALPIVLNYLHQQGYSMSVIQE